MNIIDVILPPDDTSQNIKKYFSKYGLSPYVCLSPFIQLPEGITVEDYNHKEDVCLSLFFYEKNNKNHILWKKIANEMKFSSLSYLNEVMLVTIKAIGISSRFDMHLLKEDAQKLYRFLIEKRIVRPMESIFPHEYEIPFLKSLEYLGYEKVFLCDEFGEGMQEREIAEQLEAIESERTTLDGVVICSPDFKISYTVQWDSFFTVLAAEETVLHKIVDKYHFDGFYPAEDTTYLL